MTRVKCNEGQHLVAEDQTILASRRGGGSYKRSGRRYLSRVCFACARQLLALATPGHGLTGGWEVSSLRHALDRVPGPDAGSQPVITADTITDAQIREVKRRNPHLLDTLMVAIHSTDPEFRRDARAFFADVLNGSNSGDQGPFDRAGPRRDGTP